MAQLLVRDIEETLVRLLKQRAEARGVSAEEEHRCILREALSGSPEAKPTLIEFLLSPAGSTAPETNLDLNRNRETELRDLGF